MRLNPEPSRTGRSPRSGGSRLPLTPQKNKDSQEKTLWLAVPAVKQIEIDVF